MKIYHLATLAWTVRCVAITTTKWIAENFREYIYTYVCTYMKQPKRRKTQPHPFDEDSAVLPTYVRCIIFSNLRMHVPIDTYLHRECWVQPLRAMFTPRGKVMLLKTGFRWGQDCKFDILEDFETGAKYYANSWPVEKL
jgi:hypothetical protein